MGDLGHVIELMQSARNRYSTLEARVQTWMHWERHLRAMNRSMDRAEPGTVASLGSSGAEPSEVLPETEERSFHLWVENPSRWRLDGIDSGGQPWTEIGRRYWLEPEPTEDYPIPDDTLAFEEVYDPALLVAELWLEPAGTTMAADRSGFLVRAFPRPTLRAGGMEFLHFDPPGDEYELVVDAERGIVLRLSEALEGEPMSVTEVTEVTFDAPFPSDIFKGSP